VLPCVTLRADGNFIKAYPKYLLGFSTNPNRAYIANVGQDIPHDKISVVGGGLRWPRGCFDEENKMILDVVFVMCCHVLL
jgi:hypothetical protein